jgi:hypothetical protein
MIKLTYISFGFLCGMLEMQRVRVSKHNSLPTLLTPGEQHLRNLKIVTK